MRGEYYRGALTADIARLAGLNDDLSVDAGHPRNAPYRVPLSDPADEAEANDMAGVVLGAIAEGHQGDAGWNADKTFQQCLIDARRMVSEPDYARLFTGAGATSLDDIVRSHASKVKESMALDLVCAKCGVYCREVRETRDENGNVVQFSTVCAYCGQSELHLKIMGHDP